jgi:hypothetical protein
MDLGEGLQQPKTIGPWQPERNTMLPQAPRECLSNVRQVFIMLDLVNELDHSAILMPAQSRVPRGVRRLDPRLITMLLLQAYCVGIVSSRKIERACGGSWRR